MKPKIEGLPFDRSDFIETLDLWSELRANGVGSTPFVVNLSNHLALNRVAVDTKAA